MTTYKFRVELEPDDDGWLIRCPALERYGAATWGETKEEAHKHIEEVLGTVLESMAELGMPIPDGPDVAALPALSEGNSFTISALPKLRPALDTAQSAKTYQFRVVVEPDEDQWFAYCPTLEAQGAATGGKTREEAYVNIYQVLRMTLESMISHGESIPVETPVPSHEFIAITV